MKNLAILVIIFLVSLFFLIWKFHSLSHVTHSPSSAIVFGNETGETAYSCQRKEKKNRKIFKKEINISNRRKGKWRLRCVFELFVFHDLCIPGGKFRGLLREYENTCPKSCGQWLLNHNDEMFQSSEASDMFPVISGSRFCFGNRGFSL